MSQTNEPIILTDEKVCKTWYVYKDYDGNAPDAPGDHFTNEEAAAWVRELLADAEASPDELVQWDGKRYEIACPHSDGWEWCASYRITESKGVVSESYQTITAWLADNAEEYEEDEE